MFLLSVELLTIEDVNLPSLPVRDEGRTGKADRQRQSQVPSVILLPIDFARESFRCGVPNLGGRYLDIWLGRGAGIVSKLRFAVMGLALAGSMAVSDGARILPARPYGERAKPAPAMARKGRAHLHGRKICTGR